MPVSISERDGNYCVVEPSGEIIHCHDTREQALAQMRAINANTEKEGTVSEGNTATTYTYSVDSATPLPTWVTLEEPELSIKEYNGLMPTSFDELKKVEKTYEEDRKLNEIIRDFVHLARNVLAVGGNRQAGLQKLASEMTSLLEGESNSEETGLSPDTKERPYKTDGGVKYYAKDYACVGDAEKPSTWKIRLAEKESGNITVSQLGRAASALSPGGHRGNQANLEDVGCSKAAVKGRIRSEYKKLGVADEDIPESVKVAKADLSNLGKSTGFVVWKQDDGTWRWLGTYSNKFRDDDHPVKEILSENSHKEFIDRVTKGEIGYPDLYIWHIDVPVGKADLLAYDDSGFSVALGHFNNKSNRIAKALQETKVDLAMSHGMPSEFIERDKDDPTVITRYVSTEVSVLSREAAANKLTHFSILKGKEEQNMSIAPELRDQVVQMIGEDATTDLEGQLAAQADKAIKEGIEFKEAGEEAVADTQSAEEPVAEATPEPEAKEAPESEMEEEPEDEEAKAEEPPMEEEEEEAEEEEEKSVEEKEESAVTAEEKPVEQVNIDITALKEELTGVLAGVVKAIDENNQAILERMDALESKVGELEKDEDEKLTDKAAGMTTASIASMLAQQMAGEAAQSVIGQSATHVHGNSNLAKDGPAEVEPEVGAKQEGLFFQKWTSGKQS